MFKDLFDRYAVLGFDDKQLSNIIVNDLLDLWHNSLIGLHRKEKNILFSSLQHIDCAMYCMAAG